MEAVNADNRVCPSGRVPLLFVLHPSFLFARTVRRYSLERLVPGGKAQDRYACV
jgi:hypothetical protein